MDIECLKKIKKIFLVIILMLSGIAYADDLPPTDDPIISDDSPPTDDPPVAAAPIDNCIGFLYISGIIFAGIVFSDRNANRLCKYTKTNKENKKTT